MRCSEIAALIDLMVEDNLPEELLSRIRKHLIRCSRCAHDAYSLQHAKNLLRQTFPNTEAPAPFRERALAKLHDALADQFPAQHPEPEKQLPLPNMDRQ
ncbi:MAG: anti-sigma factor family protein [Chthonomonadales bacterium]